MKYYKNENNDIFGFEQDGSQDNLITLDMVRLTKQEELAIFEPNISLRKQEELLQLKLKYELLYQEAILYKEHLYEGGLTSSLNLLAKIKYAEFKELNFIEFTTKDDIVTSLTIEESKKLYIKIFEQYENTRSKYKKDKNNLLKKLMKS